MTAEERKNRAAIGRADQAEKRTASKNRRQLAPPADRHGLPGHLSEPGKKRKTENQTKMVRQRSRRTKPASNVAIIEVFMETPEEEGRLQKAGQYKRQRGAGKHAAPGPHPGDRGLSAEQSRRRRQTVAETRAEREQVKAAMRTRILDGGGKLLPKPMPDVPKRRTIVRIILIVVLAAVLLAANVVLWRRFGTYSSYRVVWEVNAPGSAKNYVSFQKGMLAVASDGVVYYDKDGGRMWQISYQMKNPCCEVRGSYALVYDRTGKSIKILDENGLVGEASPGYPISTAAVSRAGVVAAVLSEQRSSRIVYYDREGRRIDVEIQSPLVENGFPLDIAISPDGQKLAVAYYYVAGESGACRLMFYDFSEIGQDGEQMIGAFDYSDSDTYLSYIVWMGDTCVCAVGDNRIGFYTVSDRAKEVVEKTVTIDGAVERVFQNDSYVCLLMEGADRKRIDVYGRNAVLKASIPQETVARDYCIVGQNLIMTDEHFCRIEDLEGRTRLDLDFLADLSAAVPVGDSINKLYLVLPDTVQRVNLR